MVSIPSTLDICRDDASGLKKVGRGAIHVIRIYNTKAMLEKAFCIEKFSRVSHVYLGIIPECHCPENNSFLRMAIWLRVLERWYLVIGGVAVGRGFKPSLTWNFSLQK
jgi:hypothetical protein